MKDDKTDDNRRTLHRTRVLRNARIILGHGDTGIHCILGDVSSAGAKLKFASTYKLPPTFDLTFDNGRSRRRCRRVWQTATEVGVAFEPAVAREQGNCGVQANR